MHSSLCSMSSFILFIGQNLNLKQTYQFLGSFVIILVTEILIRVWVKKNPKPNQFQWKSVQQARKQKYCCQLIKQISISLSCQREAQIQRPCSIRNSQARFHQRHHPNTSKFNAGTISQFLPHVLVHMVCAMCLTYFRITELKLLSHMWLENNSTMAPVWEIQAPINKSYAWQDGCWVTFFCYGARLQPSRALQATFGD